MTFFRAATAALLAAAAVPAAAIPIDNGVAAGTPGRFVVDVGLGGSTRTGTFTYQQQDGTVDTSDLVFDYYGYLSFGNGNGQQIGGTTIEQTGPRTVRSTSQITNGANIINVVTTASMTQGSLLYTVAYDFEAVAGSLDGMRFGQYLDEDVLGASDDIFIERGSAAQGNVNLFTLDRDTLVGISHSGAQSATDGLVNASFAGYSACVYNSIATQQLTDDATPGGNICDQLGSGSNELGNYRGPADVVSALVWAFNAGATTGRVVTTLGDLPVAGEIPDPVETPEPTALALFGLGLAGIGLRFRRRAA